MGWRRTTRSGSISRLRGVRSLRYWALAAIIAEFMRLSVGLARARLPGMKQPAQTWDPQRYARTAHFNTELAGPILALLGARRGERILDLGCGDGSLTAQLVALGCDVFAVDASAAQLAACRARGIACAVADGE